MAVASRRRASRSSAAPRAAGRPGWRAGCDRRSPARSDSTGVPLPPRRVAIEEVGQAGPDLAESVEPRCHPCSASVADRARCSSKPARSPCWSASTRPDSRAATNHNCDRRPMADLRSERVELVDQPTPGASMSQCAIPTSAAQTTTSASTAGSWRRAQPPAPPPSTARAAGAVALLVEQVLGAGIARNCAAAAVSSGPVCWSATSSSVHSLPVDDPGDGVPSASDRSRESASRDRRAAKAAAPARPAWCFTAGDGTELRCAPSLIAR